MSHKAFKWFDRTCGTWKSERRYLFDMKTLKPTNLTTNMVIDHGERSNQYVIQWQGRTNGTMEIEVGDGFIHRSRDYFGDEAHDSQYEMVDDDCIVFKTQYNGMKFREEIRLLAADTVRLRQTIGYNEETGAPVLCGQYFEQRV